MQRVNHYLSEKQVAELRRLSEQTGLSLAELIRRAVDVFLLQEKSKR